MSGLAVISGVTSCGNRGVEALIRTITDGLERIGWDRFVVLSQTPTSDSQLLNLPRVRLERDPFATFRYFSNGETPREREDSASRLLAEGNLLVTTGGDLHGPNTKMSSRYLKAPQAALAGGIPVAMIAHSVGPFSEHEAAVEWLDVARRSVCVTVRDAGSLTYLRSLGPGSDDVIHTADPAFLLPEASAHRIDALLASVDLQAGKEYVCLAPSARIAKFRMLDESSHTAMLLHTIDALWERWRLPILMIPHVHDSRPHRDDHRLAIGLAQSTDGADVRVMSERAGALEYKGLIARSKLIVAERLHAAIAGISSKVPAVTIGYSDKYLGVLSDAYGPSIDRRDVHLDVSEAVHSPDAIRETIGRFEPLDFQRELDSRVSGIQHRADSNFSVLATALRTS